MEHDAALQKKNICIYVYGEGEDYLQDKVQKKKPSKKFGGE